MSHKNLDPIEYAQFKFALIAPLIQNLYQDIKYPHPIRKSHQLAQIGWGIHHKMLGSHCVNCGINVTSINATNEIISMGIIVRIVLDKLVSPI